MQTAVASVHLPRQSSCYRTVCHKPCQNHSVVIGPHSVRWLLPTHRKRAALYATPLICIPPGTCTCAGLCHSTRPSTTYAHRSMNPPERSQRRDAQAHSASSAALCPTKSQANTAVKGTLRVASPRCSRQGEQGLPAQQAPLAQHAHCDTGTGAMTRTPAAQAHQNSAAYCFSAAPSFSDVLNTHAPIAPGFFSTATQCVDTRHSAAWIGVGSYRYRSGNAFFTASVASQAL